MSEIIDLSNIPDTPTYEPVPAGDYVVVAVEVTDCVTKKQDGKYLKVKFRIESENQNGRYLWNNFNYQNPSTTCVNIGRSDLKKMRHAMGLFDEAFNLDEMFEIIGRPIRITYDVNKKGELYFKKYESILENKPAPNIDIPNSDIIPF